MRPGLALLLASACAAGVEVRLMPGGTIDLKAEAAPVSAILECLVQQTGMKIVTEAPIPHHPLTLSMRDRTPVQAVYGLLEGLGLNYAFSTDRTGTRVELLILSRAGTQAATGAATAPRATAPTGTARPPQPTREAEPLRAPAEPEPQPTSAEPEPPPVVEGGQLVPSTPPLPGYGLPPAVALPLMPGGRPPETKMLPPDAELFPEQRPLSPVSLRDASRTQIALR